EVAAARTVFDEEKAALKRVGTDVAEHIEFGMMIEVPSAALIADRLAKLVDFFSIGTNDLVQYTLAADRMNPAVAGLYQPMHPAVLKLIEAASKAAAAAGIGCAVCGEAASDPKMIPFLLKSGISELSVGAPQVLQLRKLISGMTVGV
ncbi:MAG: putative PEP-binding protein, partial [Candidatus Thiodiazotropha sp.]